MKTKDKGKKSPGVTKVQDDKIPIAKKSGGLKDYYYLSLLICFVGIVGCYSGYGILQESL